MKRFITDFSIGVFFFCLIWLFAEHALRKIEVRNSYSYKYNYVRENSAIKVLLSGDSHIENGINPYLIGDSVFNFAIGGRSSWRGWELQIAEKLYHTMPNLKVVLLPIGYANIYSSYHFRTIRDIEKEYIYNYSRYMHLEYDRFPENLYCQSALLNNKMGVKYWVDEKVDSLGYARLEGQQDNWKNQQRINHSYCRGEIARLCYNENVKYLIQLAKICKENDIRLIIVTTPCADCYLKDVKEEGIRDLYALIDSIRAHYPVEYYNYMADPEFREDSIYYNSSHLNSYGADLFTIRLKKDLDL